MNQPNLFTDAPCLPKFGGVTYDAALDSNRLTGQLSRVFEAMKGGEWMTIQEVQAIAGGSEAGVSARIRDFRKLACGGYQVDRRRRGEASRGVWEYKLSI